LTGSGAALQAYPNSFGSTETPINLQTDASQACYGYVFCSGVPVPAHGGETRNERTGDQIRLVLQNRFNVLLKPGQ
jgi:enamine deaminase RidA (YjgF/YER057c/UK114 family)